MEKTQSRKLLFLAIILFLERFAYTNLLVQLPIYIAQKGIANTLGWGQEIKGWIFFFWALVQNITPIFFGAISDRISPQKATTLAILISCIGYLGLCFADQILLFVGFILLVGFGSGWFKPSLQGLFAKISSKKIWAIYLFVSNTAFLVAILFSKILRDIGWEFVFVGSFFVSLLNLLISLSILSKQKEKYETSHQTQGKALLEVAEILRLLKGNKLLLILGFTTCFAMIYMQFYETLPNFIVDWIDTSKIVSILNLPEVFTMETSLGKQISYEILYILNPLLILLFVVPIQRISEGRKIENTLIISFLLLIVGFTFCGFTRAGEFLLLGIITYTFGEMLFNMKVLDLISQIAPEERKSTYFGLLNISYTLGLTTGALVGGYIFKEFAEKFTLAIKFLGKGYSTDPLGEISRTLHISNPTGFLWDYYKPYLFWLPYMIIGICGILIIAVYKKYKFK